MRIDRFDLIAFGLFEKRTLELSEGNLGLHLIYGDNEAGKSTALRALMAWLFGFPRQTCDDYLHSYPNLRVGGKLKLSHGTELEFIRKKGVRNTLLKYKTEEPIEDSTFHSFLPGNIDEKIFTKLWGINHSRLAYGSNELLQQSGELAQAIFSSAIGTENLRKILSDLQSVADEIFLPQGRQRKLNEAISHFREAQDRMRGNRLPIGDWIALKDDLITVNSALEKIKKEISKSEEGKKHFNRLKRLKDALAQRKSVKEQIASLGEVRLLPVNFENKSQTELEKLRTAIEAKEKSISKQKNLEKETQTLVVKKELLENEVEITSLSQVFYGMEEKIKNRPEYENNIRLLLSDSEKLLRKIRSDIKTEEVEKLRLFLNRKNLISELANKHSLLSYKKETFESALRNLLEERDLIKKKLEKQLPSNIDLIELKSMISFARQAGKIEIQCSDLQKFALKEKSECENELLRLGRYEGTIETFFKTSMPLSETLAIFEKEFENLGENQKTLMKEQKANEEMKIQAEQELNVLLQTNQIPTISELEESRASRNKGWSLIKQKYIEKMDVENEIREYSSVSNLSSHYEQKVNFADQISDKLRIAADRVAKRVALEAEIEKCKSNLKKIGEEISKGDKLSEFLQKEWNSIWEPLGVKSSTPREMKQWLLKAENLVKKIQSANEKSDWEKSVSEQCNKLKESLSLHINKFDNSINLQGKSLEEMISICERKKEQEEEIRHQKLQLEEKLDEIGNKLIKNSGDLESIKINILDWNKEWRQAVEKLDLATDLSPQHVIEAIEHLTTFFEKFDKANDLQKIVLEINLTEEKFKNRLSDFLSSIGYKKDIQEMRVTIKNLNQDLVVSREACTKLKEIERQIKEVQKEIDETDFTIQIQNEVISSLKRDAGVEKEVELIIAGEKSDKKRQLQQNLETVEIELNRNSDGHNIDEIEKEAGQLGVDAIEGKLESISQELQEFGKTKDDLIGKKTTFENQLKEMEKGNSEAANASQAAEEHLATVTSLSEKYLRLKIAELILKKQIEDYRIENQTPVLRRAGEIFSKLTLGLYQEISEWEADGKIVGLGPITVSGRKSVPIDQMSNGTRDQLYLAIRLATLKANLGKEPMPFVVDDILIGFDDNRTKAAIEVLVEFAEQTQVLLFTHHRRVIELSQEIKAKAGIFIHELTNQLSR
ncbi:MAG: AAA family ATPase [Candidatus Riflebacteria bacterium]|nr:AAA family ATPase [Candidatus Riflebacteria bacterium]